MFTLDPTTQWGQVRYLIGDTDPANHNFEDEDIQAFLNMPFGLAGTQSVLFTCAFCCDCLASRAAANLESVTIGDYTNDQSDLVKALQVQADRFRNIELNMPAFAAIEENLSGFNELTILRNWVLRTEM